jgi:predicted Fe-Mo cluster-binding NifX family protein
MIIAIPLFQTRVAPRFDCARRFLLAEIVGNDNRRPRQVTIDPASIQKRIQQLRDLKVDMIICGGIDSETTALLHRSNLRLIAWVAGEAEDAVQCLLRGELESGTLVDRGGHGNGRWAFRKRSLGFPGEVFGEGVVAPGPEGPGPARRRGRRSGLRGQGRWPKG